MAFYDDDEGIIQLFTYILWPGHPHSDGLHTSAWIDYPTTFEIQPDFVHGERDQKFLFNITHLYMSWPFWDVMSLLLFYSISDGTD